MITLQRTTGLLYRATKDWKAQSTSTDTAWYRSGNFGASGVEALEEALEALEGFHVDPDYDQRCSGMVFIMNCEVVEN